MLSDKAFGMSPSKLIWLGLSVVSLNASALPEIDPDWKESEAPPAPSFSKHQVIPIEMPQYVTLRFGVDPVTLAITPDGIVRYVMVATNDSGALSAMYEGIRCATGEVKTYAHYTSSGNWATVKDPKWQGMNDNLRSKHALAFARQAACDSRSTVTISPAEIIKALKK